MLRTEPRFEPVVNRRRVLTGGVALAVLAIATPACSSPPAPPAVDELEAQLTLARHDSELATAAAAGASQAVSTALTQVAGERTQHAQALANEIKRVAPTLQRLAATTSPTDHHVGRRDSPSAGGRRGHVATGVGGQRRQAGEHLVGLSRRAARLDRRVVYGVLQRRAGSPERPRRDIR